MLFVAMKIFLFCLLFGGIACSKRRHRENLTSSVLPVVGVIEYGEVIGVGEIIGGGSDYELYLDDDTKNEFVYSRLSFYYYDR